MTHPNDFIKWGPERTTPREAPLSALPVDTEALNLQKKQRLALSALLDRYTKSAAPTPPSGSRVFYDWLQDFGTSMQKGATEDPTLSTLGAFGQGFAGASSGVDRRSAERSKMRSRSLQNLASEMTLLKGFSELQPYKYMSPDEAVAAGFHRKDKVLRGRGNQPPKLVKAFKTTPTTFERISDGVVFTVPEGSPDIEHYRQDYENYRVIGKPRATVGKAGFTTFENQDPNSSDYEKIEQVPLSDKARIAELMEDQAWIRTGVPSIMKKGAIPTGFATFENLEGTIKQIPLSNTAEVAEFTRNKEWTRTGAPSIGKKGAVPLTAENTAKGKPYAEWRPFFEKSIAGGDTPILNLETNVPSAIKPTAEKLGFKTIKASDVGSDGKFPHLKETFNNLGKTDTLVVDLNNMKPSIMKATAAPDEWSPATKEDLEKPEWIAAFANMPWGMYAEINKKDNTFRYQTKPKMGYLTFSDPKKIRPPVTVREDETDLIKQLTDKKMIKQSYVGDLATAGASFMARWQQGRENTNFGNKIIDMIEGHIRLDRDTVGAVGYVKGIYQTSASMIADIAKSKVFGSTGNHFRDAMLGGQIEEEALNAKVAGLELREWFNPLIPANEQLEQTLIYTIAMANKPSGRLNLQDLQRAERQVKVTGWTSVDNVITSLDVARKVFNLRAESYTRLIEGKSPFPAPDEGKKIKRMRRKPGGGYEVVP